MGRRRQILLEEVTMVRVVGPAPWTTRVRCHGCFLLLEVSSDDVLYRGPGIGANATWPRFYAACPVCRQPVSLHAVPPEVQAMVRRRLGVADPGGGTIIRRG